MRRGIRTEIRRLVERAKAEGWLWRRDGTRKLREAFGSIASRAEPRPRKSADSRRREYEHPVRRAVRDLQAELRSADRERCEIVSTLARLAELYEVPGRPSFDARSRLLGSHMGITPEAFKRTPRVSLARSFDAGITRLVNPPCASPKFREASPWNAWKKLKKDARGERTKKRNLLLIEGVRKLARDAAKALGEAAEKRETAWAWVPETSEVQWATRFLEQLQEKVNTGERDSIRPRDVARAFRLAVKRHRHLDVLSESYGRPRRS